MLLQNTQVIYVTPNKEELHEVTFTGAFSNITGYINLDALVKGKEVPVHTPQEVLQMKVCVKIGQNKS